jgi:hypothetical protein
MVGCRNFYSEKVILQGMGRNLKKSSKKLKKHLKPIKIPLITHFEKQEGRGQVQPLCIAIPVDAHAFGGFNFLSNVNLLAIF